jgi:hypothetical protein
MNIFGLDISVSKSTSTMSKWSRRTAIVAIGVVNGAVLFGGVATAFWTTTGSGTGASAAGAALPVTFTQTTPNASALYPGGNADVLLIVSNPNPFPVSVDSLTLPTTTATSFTTSAFSTANLSCNASTGVTWAYTSKSLTGVIVAGKSGSSNGTLTLTLTNGAHMDNTSDTSCQNSFFEMPNVTTASVSSSTATPAVTATQ